MENTTLLKPNIVVDMTGRACPHPLLGARRVLEDMKSGEILLLKSDCPGTRDDLFPWAKSTGNDVLRSERDGDGVTGYYLRKGRKTGISASVILDVSGMICPGPVIEARKTFHSMGSGAVMKLVSTCPSTRDEVKTWCSATGNTLLDTQEIGSRTWAFFIRKG